MPKALSESQVDAFNADGYCFPIQVLGPEETLRYRRGLEAVESRSLGLRTDLHLIMRWAWDLIHDPRIVDPVEDVLGPNILCWSLNWFIKEPGEEKFVSYHQDATYWGLEPHDVVTAWLALSDAGLETGPMKFIPGSHKWPVHSHIDTREKQNMLTRGQMIDTELDESPAVVSPLAAGEMSLHHVRLVHGSEPNTTDDRRIGMVIRYMAPNVRQTKVDDTAVLVRGEDTHRHFELLPAPERDMGEAELARHADALARMQRALYSD